MGARSLKWEARPARAAEAQEAGEGRKCPTLQNDDKFKFEERKCVFVYSSGWGEIFWNSGRGEGNGQGGQDGQEAGKAGKCPTLRNYRKFKFVFKKMYSYTLLGGGGIFWNSRRERGGAASDRMPVTTPCP